MKTVRKLYDKITRDRWEIGFVDGGVPSVMGNEPLVVHWLKHDYKDRWFADPFVLDVTETEILVLVEEYRYECGNGRIALLIIDKTSFELKKLDVVLELDTHLSFPAIWRENGRVYVYPESWKTGELCVYEFDGKCCDLSSKQVICQESMADAVMTDLFGKRMLFSVQENDKLRIYDFNADTSLFELSYVKPFGKATARNAGDFFAFDGKVYRPAQVCVERYGQAVEIQQVIWNQNGNFCFVPYKTLCSTHASLDMGLHTLNSYKGITVIDVHGWNNTLAVKSIIAIKKAFLGSEWKRKKPK